MERRVYQDGRPINPLSAPRVETPKNPMGWAASIMPAEGGEDEAMDVSGADDATDDAPDGAHDVADEVVDRDPVGNGGQPAAMAVESLAGVRRLLAAEMQRVANGEVNTTRVNSLTALSKEIRANAATEIEAAKLLMAAKAAIEAPVRALMGGPTARED